MIAEGAYSAFVLSAYGVSGVVLALVAAAVFLDARGRRRELDALDAAGLRRRSAVKDR